MARGLHRGLKNFAIFLKLGVEVVGVAPRLTSQHIMSRTKQTERKSKTIKGDVKPPRAPKASKSPHHQLARRRIISPADMDVYLEAEGFKKLCSFGERGSEVAVLGEDASHRDLWVRFEATVTEGGEQGAFLWQAKYRGSQPNCNTGKPEYLFNYTKCVCPKSGNPWDYVPGMCINQGNDRYSLYVK